MSYAPRAWQMAENNVTSTTQFERKTKDGLVHADLMNLKVDELKRRCYEENVGVTGKKDVLVARLLDPKKHQLQLLKQEVFKAIKDQMVYTKGMGSGRISWHRDNVKWAARRPSRRPSAPPMAARSRSR